MLKSRARQVEIAAWPLKRRQDVSPGLFGAFRRTLHGWLLKLAALVEPRDPDYLSARLAPGDSVWQSYVDAATALMQAGRFDEADAILMRGLTAFPGDGTMIYRLAYSAHNRGNFAVAAERWKVALDAAPVDPLCICALAANLRASHQMGQASTVIDDALKRFPGDCMVNAEAARTAMARRSFHEALLHWEVALAHERPSPDWLHGRIDALARVDRLDDAEAALKQARERFPEDTRLAALAETFASMRQERADAPKSEKPVVVEALSPGALVSEFESLGNNCEFGLVQRYCGVEPLGLFRFSCSQAINLEHAFETGFKEYGTESDLVFEIMPHDGEYTCKSRHYKDFEYHTEVFAPGGELEKLRPRELRKVAYLKERLNADLKAGEKIFVRKGGSYEEAVDLFRVIRKIGPNILLWVEVANADHPSGDVEIVEDGLLKGHIARFAPLNDAPSLALREWLDVCANALALARGARGQIRRYFLAENKVLQIDQIWQMEGPCGARLTDAVSFSDHPVFELTLTKDTTRADAIVARRFLAVPIAERSLAVFAVWVLVPDSFRGSFIDVYFINSPNCFLSRADLDKRNVWQRVWTSTRMPKDQPNGVIGLRVTAYKDDVIYVSTWRLEEGCVPNDWPMDEKATAVAEESRSPLVMT